jgi:hypothetical protein
MMMQEAGYVAPEITLTEGRSFMQVQAGGKLAGRAAALKKEMHRLGSGPGVYIVFVRPPCAQLWEWTPVYCGMADKSTGERCSSYLARVSIRDAPMEIFLGDKLPCADKKQPDECKCKFYTDLAARGFDVAIL